MAGDERDGARPSGSTCVIAEAGVNHDGSVERARRLVDVARSAGADVVKFQTFVAEKVCAADAPGAAYQRASTGDAVSQRDVLRSLELDRGAHRELRRHCDDRDIEFLSTPFDASSASFLAEEIGVRRLKVASGEITNGPLLLHIARLGLPVILSTGMSTLAEVQAALGVLAFGFVAEPASRPGPEGFAEAYGSAAGKRALRDRVALLQCTTAYPAPVGEIHLRAMDTLRAAFDLPVGLSDHSTGIAVPIASVARGAEIVEKHVTLDRGLEGPDHAASLEPDELEAMVAGIRSVERALGDPAKGPTPSEEENLPVVRRSLVASRPIAAGEEFTAGNLAATRPGSGVSPMRYWDYLGRKAGRDYEEGARIE